MSHGTNEGSERQRIKSVETAFRIIEGLEREEGASVSTISKECDLARSTVYVYMNTLESKGYIIKKDGSYHLGPRFLKHGCFARKQMKIYRVSTSELDQLANQTGELVSLGIEDGGKRVVLYRAEGTNAVYDQSPTGDYTHMHWSSLGKALLASLPADRVDEIIDEHGLPRATEKTITDHERLIAELDVIAERGYAIENEEREPGIRSIGRAIVVDGEVKGAIAIAGPKHRFTAEYIENFCVELHKHSNVIELRYKHY